MSLSVRWLQAVWDYACRATLLVLCPAGFSAHNRLAARWPITESNGVVINVWSRLQSCNQIGWQNSRSPDKQTFIGCFIILYLTTLSSKNSYVAWFVNDKSNTISKGAGRLWNSDLTSMRQEYQLLKQLRHVCSNTVTWRPLRCTVRRRSVRERKLQQCREKNERIVNEFDVSASHIETTKRFLRQCLNWTSNVWLSACFISRPMSVQQATPVSITFHFSPSTSGKISSYEISQDLGCPARL